MSPASGSGSRWALEGPPETEQGHGRGGEREPGATVGVGLRDPPGLLRGPRGPAGPPGPGPPQRVWEAGHTVSGGHGSEGGEPGGEGSGEQRGESQTRPLPACSSVVTEVGPRHPSLSDRGPEEVLQHLPLCPQSLRTPGHPLLCNSHRTVGGQPWARLQGQNPCLWAVLAAGGCGGQSSPPRPPPPPSVPASSPHKVPLGLIPEETGSFGSIPKHQPACPRKPLRRPETAPPRWGGAPGLAGL